MTSSGPAASGMETKTPANHNGFLCGVVEGFYGRPWTTEQRKDLFTKLESWGINSYLYAPKDDCKHRAYWREPYTVDEAEHLQSLITMANDCNIDFYYAISPGLDVTYSNSKDVSCLKRKLEQVSQLGCKAFALLFDDIEPEMCKQDKEVFQSFAHAQVSITNEIFEHLSQPKFLFCPTQYCRTRAVPTVRNSEYLNTIGSKLSPEIQIMWTGDKVISKVISDKSLEDINDVLRRPCVIWDNEHANDYDQKRVFLGPYSGRSPEIKSKLAGVMTNPNCEYGANFVGIHTLAQWSHCTVDGTLPTISSDTVSSDIKLENGDDEELSDASLISLPANVYHPKKALLQALRDWLPEFSRQKTVWGPMSKPQVGLSQPTLILGVNTCIAGTSTTAAGNPAENPAETSNSKVEPIPVEAAPVCPITIAPPETDDLPIAGAPPAVEVDATNVQPITLPVMNSLVATNKVIVDASTSGDTDMLPEAPVTPTPPAPVIPPVTVLPKMPLIPANVGDAPEMASSADHAAVKQVQISAAATVLPTTAITPQYTEPMECVDPDEKLVVTPANTDHPMESSNNSPSSTPNNLEKAESNSMLIEQDPCSPASAVIRTGGDIVLGGCEAVNKEDELLLEDLLLLCQLFYLPAEHGQSGLDMLNLFYWLKRNGCAMLPKGSPAAGTQEDRDEWLERADKFDAMVNKVEKLFGKLCACQNRELVYDIYTYLWDMCCVLMTLNGFVSWLRKGVCSPKLQSYVVGQQTWFSGIREAFLSGDYEPWVFRGGLISDLLRLLPLDSGHDLYMYKYPEVPANVLFKTRPYEPRDQKEVYSLIAKEYEEEIDAPLGLCESDRIVVGDRRVGAFLNLFPEFCFVCESTKTKAVVAFACTAPSARVYFTKHNSAWLPGMKLKYPKKVPIVTDDSMLSPIEEMALEFHASEDVHAVPAGLEAGPPAPGSGSGDPACAVLPWGIFRLCIETASIHDQSVAKTLTMLALASLRASGTIRAYAQVSSINAQQRELYRSIGFTNPTTPIEAKEPAEAPVAKTLTVTRTF